MDKTIVLNDKNAQNPIVYELVPKMGVIHKRFGLWICAYGKGRSASPCEKPLDIIDGRYPIQPRVFTFHSISHLIAGTGFHWEPDNGARRLKPGDCVLTSPGRVHSYGAYPNDANTPYVEDTLCFTGPMAERLAESGILNSLVFPLGKGRRLLPIIDLAMDPSSNAQIQANMALMNFLVEIHLGAACDSTAKPRTTASLDALTREIKRHPARWWSIAEMAEFCGLSESRFRAVFRRHVGVTAKQYVDKAKMAVAAEKLCGSSVSIASLAESLGYADPYHFSRRFKQLMGCSPDAYRTRRGLKERSSRVISA